MLRKVLDIWQARSAEKLTLTDAEEILTSTSRFFKVLEKVHNAHASPPLEGF